MDKTQPLALPQGSVRAILAIVLTGAAIAGSFWPVVPAEYLWPAALTVNAFYFGAAPKRGEGGDK